MEEKKNILLKYWQSTGQQSIVVLLYKHWCQHYISVSVALLLRGTNLYIAIYKILCMETDTKSIMSNKTPELISLEAEWNDSETILIRAKVTPEAAAFLEEMAFKDFGMMKKGALGLELTKLILVAKRCLSGEK